MSKRPTEHVTCEKDSPRGQRLALAFLGNEETEHGRVKGVKYYDDGLRVMARFDFDTSAYWEELGRRACERAEQAGDTLRLRALETLADQLGYDLVKRIW